MPLGVDPPPLPFLIFFRMILFPPVRRSPLGDAIGESSGDDAEGSPVCDEGLSPLRLSGVNGDVSASLGVGGGDV